MWNHSEITWWIICFCLSVFVSGIELTYIAAGKLQYVLGNKVSRVGSFMLDSIFRHYRRFQGSLMMARVVLIVLFVYFSILVAYQYSDGFLHEYFILIPLVVVGATLLLLLANEFLPRVLFAGKNDFWVRLFLLPAYLLHIILFPIIILLSGLSKMLFRLSGGRLSESDEESLFYRPDFDSIVDKSVGETSKETEVDSEVKIFRNALNFSSKKLRDCMVPRADIVAVPLDTSLEKLKELFIESGMSRILVYKDNLDNILGYIHVWEIFNNPPDWTNNLASLSFVPESMQANQLMSDLMQNHKSIAVVVDEFGGTSGIITMEDLVEEIFGDIEDEYDVESKFVKQESENEFVMSGRVEIDHLNEEYQLQIPESDDYSTVAGYLLHHMKRFPKTYETVVIGKYTFKILKVTARKIEVVKLITGGDSAEDLLS